ncbi:hypothetical protein AAD018_007915 [Aestuariibius insulae]|uniref:hypothetical protein n=1 Tax=Aestuariibius insulae TaxID=2058287 RepID=UPI00345EBFB2
MLISLAGILLLGIILLDIFLTVLDANGLSVVSSRIYRIFWWGWRHFSRIMPPVARPQMLALAAPLMIPLIIGVWIFGIVLGFTLVYFGGLSHQDLITGGGSQPSLQGAFRLSWVTLSTIGFVEVSPSNMPYSLTVALEAILGNLVLTFTITYFLSVHGAVMAYNKFASLLRNRIPDPDRPLDALSWHFEAGEPRELEHWLRQINDGVSTLHEGLRRYPVLYYFRPIRIYRGVPHTLFALRRIVTALRWCLPEGHRARTSPNLKALEVGLDELVEDLQDRYVPVHLRTTAKPVSYKQFRAAQSPHLGVPDTWVEMFLRDCDETSRATGVEIDPLAPETYENYREWLPYVLRLFDFERAIRTDLGYSSRVRPGRSSTLAVISNGPKQRPQALRHAEPAE